MIIVLCLLAAAWLVVYAICKSMGFDETSSKLIASAAIFLILALLFLVK